MGLGAGITAWTIGSLLLTSMLALAPWVVIGLTVTLAVIGAIGLGLEAHGLYEKALERPGL